MQPRRLTLFLALLVLPFMNSGAETSRLDEATAGRFAALALSCVDHGLAGVSDEFYAGSHWLASFAIYLQTKRGLSTSP